MDRSDSALRVAVVAEEAAGARLLTDLATRPYTVVAVATSQQEGRRGTSVRSVAEKYGYPTWPVESVTTQAFAEHLAHEQVDLLLNVHALVKVHGDVVVAPRIGSFNLHPGPLPAYAGLNAPSWAIVNGESTHAVTLHWMEAHIDTGPVAFTTSFPITPMDTGLSVTARCVEHGLPLVRRLLALAVEGRPIPRLPQAPVQRRYYRRRDVPYGGQVSWTLTAGAIEAFVRASDFHPFPSPWGVPRARIGGWEVGLAKVRRSHRRCDVPPGTIGEIGPAGIDIATGDEWLAVTQLEMEGRRVSPDALLERGIPLG